MISSTKLNKFPANAWRASEAWESNAFLIADKNIQRKKIKGLIIYLWPEDAASFRYVFAAKLLMTGWIVTIFTMQSRYVGANSKNGNQSSFPDSD